MSITELCKIVIRTKDELKTRLTNLARLAGNAVVAGKDLQNDGDINKPIRNQDTCPYSATHDGFMTF